MKNNYIYVPGLSETVANEVKKEEATKAPAVTKEPTKAPAVTKEPTKAPAVTKEPLESQQDADEPEDEIMILE